MEWSIIIHEKDGYVEVITCGVADRDGSLNMAKTLSHTMRINKITRALIDHRNIEEVVSKPFDIYNRPKIFRLIGVILKIKIAEIIRTEHSEHFKFFETVCLNQGFQISIFQDKDKALNWLLI
jgi:hypothetical protein